MEMNKESRSFINCIIRFSFIFKLSIIFTIMKFTGSAYFKQVHILTSEKKSHKECNPRK
jgi:hypothetical protein